MADQVFNIGLGRIAEWYVRVDTNDPTNAAFIVAAWVSGGASDATIKDYDDVAAIEGDASAAEATNSNYSRKSLVDSDLVAFSPDDTNDRVDLDIPDQTWTGVGAGDNWTDLGIHFDSDTASGTDANIENGTWHDFAVTPDGSDITAQIDAAGFFRAS